MLGDGKVVYDVREVCVDVVWGVGVFRLGYSCVEVRLWISESLGWDWVFKLGYSCVWIGLRINEQLGWL